MNENISKESPQPNPSPPLIFTDSYSTETPSDPLQSNQPGPSQSMIVFKPNTLESFNIKPSNKISRQIPSGEIISHHINSQLFNELYNNAKNQQESTKYNLFKNKEKSKNLLVTQKELAEELTQKSVQPDNTDLTDTHLGKRTRIEDPNSKEFLGPWAVFPKEQQFVREIIKPVKRIIADSDKAFFLKDKPQEKFPGEMDPNYPPRPSHDVADTNFEPKAIFHLESKLNYQNESFLEPTKDKTVLKNLSQCFVPNKCLFTYKGHTKPVSIVRFFPRYGHLILSGSFDKSIRLWDVSTHRKCVQTYLGHSEAVNDISWSNDGRSFLSCGFDSRIQYWDTETGKVIKTFNVQKHPYCVRLNPDEDRQHLFLTGSMNSKIDQYDIRASICSTQYIDHVSPVNTILFVDNNKKFVSCGDDKKIFLWEFGVPLVVRSLNEPEVAPITRTTLHPCGNYFVGQTTENKLHVFDVKGGSLRLNRKKRFVGHVNAGFAIRPIFSPNGFYVLSGDHLGRIHAWDWKTEIQVQNFQAHSGVCVELDWHPNDSSVMVSGSWDHHLRLWGK